MFRSIIPTTAGLNNSKYVHANVDEYYKLCNLNNDEVNHNLEHDLSLSSKNIINAANSYNINVGDLANCKTPEEIAIKIIKSQNLENKRKYADADESYDHINKRILNINNEKIHIYNPSNDHMSQNMQIYNHYANQNFQNDLTNYMKNVNPYQNQNYLYTQNHNQNVNNHLLNYKMPHSYTIEQEMHNSSIHNNNLHNSNLHNSNLHNSNLHNNNLHNSNLHNSNLHNNNLHNSNLHNSNLHNSNLHNNNLHNSNLHNSNLHNNNLHINNLHISNLYNSILHNSVNANFSNNDNCNAINGTIINKIDQLKLAYKIQFTNSKKCDENTPTLCNNANNNNFSNHYSFNDSNNSFNYVNNQNYMNNNMSKASDIEEYKMINQLLLMNKEYIKINQNSNENAAFFNRMRESNQISEHNKVNEVEEESNVNKLSDVNEANEINEFNTVVEINKGEQTNKNENFNSVAILNSTEKENVTEENLNTIKSNQINEEKDEEKNSEQGNEKNNPESSFGNIDHSTTQNTINQIYPKKNSICIIFDENIEYFLNLNTNDINKNKKMKKIITCIEDCLKNDKNIIYDDRNKIETLFNKLFSNIETFLSKEISYIRKEKKKITHSDEPENLNEFIENNSTLSKKNKKHNSSNNEIMNDIIFSHYNMLLYVILMNFECFKKHLNNDDLNEKVLFNLKINLKNIIIKLCLNEIKNRMIEFYNIHENFLIQLNFIYEKSLSYMYDIYIYIEKYDTILINLIDLCLLSFQIHYNVQNVIVNSINLLLKVFKSDHKKNLKKYIIDNLLLNINHINFRYNKMNFKNNNSNSTYIHLVTFFLIKVSESFSFYSNNLKDKFLLQQEKDNIIGNNKKKTKKSMNSSKTYDDHDDNDDGEYIEEHQENDNSEHLTILSDKSFSLSLFTSEEENDDPYNIEAENHDQWNANSKKIKKKISKLDSFKSNNTNTENNYTRKKYSLRKKKNNKFKNYDIYEYDNLNNTNELYSLQKIENKPNVNKRKHTNIGKYNQGYTKNKNVNPAENEFNEQASSGLFNNFVMKVNFKRLNSVVNYILIEMVDKILYQDNKNARTILQYLILDIINCCDNPHFSISTLFIKNMIHIFFDIINKKHESNIKEVCIFILRYIFKYVFNIYNYINYSCFHLLYNFNKELNKNMFIKPFFQVNNCDNGSTNSFKEIKDKENMQKQSHYSKQKMFTELSASLDKEELHSNFNEIQLIKCCNETKKKEKMFQCLQCENLYHFTCIYKDANKLNVEYNMYEENEYFDKNLSILSKKENVANCNDEEKNNAIINKINASNIIEYECDNCKLKNMVKVFIIKETQVNNSFLNLKFKKKKEKNKGFYCYEKFISNLKVFVVYYYYLLIHINKNILNEHINENCNNIYSYILLLYNNFAHISENDELNISSKCKILEKKKSNNSIKRKKLEKSHSKSDYSKKINDFLIYEYKNVNKKEDIAVSFSHTYNFDVYINSVWRLYLYFVFYDVFFLAFNQLFYILYENSNKNLRYYSISIINNIINDNYLYLKCQQTQYILLSCLADNYIKVREYTLYIFYNFCKNFLEVELLINNYKKIKDKDQVEELKCSKENQELPTCSNDNSDTTDRLNDGGKKKKNKEEENHKPVEDTHFGDSDYSNNNFNNNSNDKDKKPCNNLHKGNCYNSYNKSIDLNEYITKDVIDSIKRCSKDIKISVRIISVKILKYIIYFNIYVKNYNQDNAHHQNRNNNKCIEEKRDDINGKIIKQNCINDNILILNDLMERYVSTFDNDTMKNIILEILIELFFLNIFTKSTKDSKNTLTSSSFSEVYKYNESLDDSSVNSIESEEGQSIDINENSNKYIKIKKTMYSLFIHLLYVMKNKHNINIINKMLAHIDKNMKKYEDKFSAINEILNENTLEKSKKKFKKGEQEYEKENRHENDARYNNNNYNISSNGNNTISNRNKAGGTSDDDYSDTENEKGNKNKNKLHNLEIVKNNIYNIYMNSSYKHLEVLNKNSIKYILEVWIYNLICLFIKSRRNNTLENETKKIINIFNIIIEIIPSLFIKYINFFYPYIYNNDVSKDICELLSSIIPYCKYDLQLKLQFKRVNFNNSLLYHNNLFTSRSYIHLLCTLHTYIFCNFVYFKSYIEECFIKLHKYKLCFLVNNFIVQLNDFIREFHFMKPEEKLSIKNSLCEMYHEKVPSNTYSSCNEDDTNGKNSNYDPINNNNEDNPNNYFIDNVIDMKYEEFVCHLDQYKKHIFEMFSITQCDIININKYAWFISVMLEFINMNVVIINDMYSENIDESIHIQIKSLREDKKKSINMLKSLKNKKNKHNPYVKSNSINEESNMKYIKLSDLVKNVKVYASGILYFEFMNDKQINYIKKWNTLKLKNEIVAEVIKKKICIQKIEKFMEICNYKFYNVSLILINLLMDIFYLSNDIKYKCFFIHCLSKVLSNYYNSHFLNDLKLRNVFFYCISSSNATLQKSGLYTLLQIIKTYEHFLSNKNNIISNQTPNYLANKKSCLNNSKNSAGSLAKQKNAKISNKGANKNKKQLKNKGFTSEQISCDDKTKLIDSNNYASDTNHFSSKAISSKVNEVSNKNKFKGKKYQKDEIKKEEELMEDRETEVEDVEVRDSEREMDEKRKKQYDEYGDKGSDDNILEKKTESEKSEKNDMSVLNSHNKDIIHVLQVGSLFTQNIIDILMINTHFYTKCNDEELNFIKNIGIQILYHLYKEGFIQSSKILPSVFCLFFSNDIKLKLRSEKVINYIIEKESCNFLNNLAECLQQLLFYVIENNYMNTKTDNKMCNVFLFGKMESSFFKILLDIYDNLSNKKLKLKYLKIILKEIENACHFVLYDKIKNFMRNVNNKYNNNVNNRNINSQNVSVEIYPISQIYSHIIKNYIPLNDDNQESIRKLHDSASNSSKVNHILDKKKNNKKKINKVKAKAKTKAKAIIKEVTKTESKVEEKESEAIFSKNISMKKEENYTTDDVSNNSSLEQNNSNQNIMNKILDKYNNLSQKYMTIDEYAYINYFLFLYIQMLTYLISYLNFSTYNEIILLIHDINKVYYIITSTINISNDIENLKCDNYSTFSINQDIGHLTNDEEINRESEIFSLINLNLNKIKFFVIVLLNHLTNNLIKHYNIDTSRLNDLNEEESIKESKIEFEKREEKKNIFNYYEYIYDCIEIFVEDNTTLIEKYSKYNLNFHDINNDYLNKLISDGKNKKFMQKKKQKETAKLKRLNFNSNN